MQDLSVCIIFKTFTLSCDVHDSFLVQTDAVVKIHLSFTFFFSQVFALQWFKKKWIFGIKSAMNFSFLTWNQSYFLCDGKVNVGACRYKCIPVHVGRGTWVESFLFSYCAFEHLMNNIETISRLFSFVHIYCSIATFLFLLLNFKHVSKTFQIEDLRLSKV